MCIAHKLAVVGFYKKYKFSLAVKEQIQFRTLLHDLLLISN